MDREIRTNVMDAVDRAIAKRKPPGRRPKYSRRVIAGMYLWSVWHDRRLSRACDRLHYGDLFRPRALPGISRFARRVRDANMRRILQFVHGDLASTGLAGPVGYLDGKPLAVSAVSKDPDARAGHVTGGYARGCKLRAYVTEERRIRVWSVTALPVAEQSVAMPAYGGWHRLRSSDENALMSMDAGATGRGTPRPVLVGQREDTGLLRK